MSLSPAALPRLLTIMGSGETTPTMSRVHRSLLDRLGRRPVPAVVIDTPYGFQENADDITARAIEYFRDSVGNPLSVSTFRCCDDDQLVRETAAARIREASYVFAGPGSPTYALRVWSGTEMPRLVAAKLAAGGSGGAVTVASAAALTVGRFTLPVYEIYKAGEDAHWLPGLDLLSALGLGAVAVVPHYDNNEGGNHDTRYCFMGERRLRLLEDQLPDEAYILGIDGHTALLLDLDERTASVAGLGSVTVRRRGQSRVFASGTTITIDQLLAVARELDPARQGSPGADAVQAAPLLRPRVGVGPAAPASAHTGEHPLVAEVATAEDSFRAALASSDVAAAIRVALDLESRIREWSRDTEESSVIDDARSALRSMIVRLGEAAASGDAASREASVAPLVDALVELRLEARAGRNWTLADSIRDRLLAAGYELHDSPDGTTWELRDQAKAVR